MKNKIIDIVKVLICFLLFFSISTILKLFLFLFKIDVSKFNSRNIVIFQFVISLIMVIVLFIIYFNEFKNDFIKFKKSINDNVHTIINLFLIFMIVKFIVSIFSSFLLIVFGYNGTDAISINQQSLENYVRTLPLLMVFSGCIFAPFYEEGIFRLGIKKVFNNKWLFIIVSGSLFGLLHIFPLKDGVTVFLGLIQSITYVTMGIFLSYIYYKKNNIYISIGVHLLNNLLSMLVLLRMY